MLRKIIYSFINIFLLLLTFDVILFLGSYINGLLVHDNLILQALMVFGEAIVLNAALYAINRWFLTIVTAMKDEGGIALKTFFITLTLSIIFIVLMVSH